MASNLDPIFESSAKQHGIDPSLLRAIAETESHGNPNAISKDDNGNPVAYGLMQFTPATAKAIGLSDPMNPSQSIPAAAKLLRQNLDASNGDEKAALMMYHGGTDQKNWGPKTQAYPVTVANNQAKIVQQKLAGNDPVYQFFNTGTAQQAASTDPVYNFFASGGGNVPKAQDIQPNSLEADWQNKSNAGSNILKGVAGGAAHLLTGIGSSIVGGYKGLATLATGGSMDDAANAVTSYQQDHTYSGEPGTMSGRSTQLLDSPKNPLNWIGQGANYAGGKVSDVTGSPALGATVSTGINAIPLIAGLRFGKTPIGKEPVSVETAPVPTPVPTVAASPNLDIPTYIRKQQEAFNQAKAAPVQSTQTVPEQPIPQTPVQSAQTVPTPQTPKSPVQSSIPKMQDVIKNTGDTNHPVGVARVAEASSLPIPIELTRGQASGDINVLSTEQNVRGSQPAIAERLNAQNGQLIENINTIRDKAAPDVTAINHVENGQALIDSYKATDAVRNADISAKYKALEEANGGAFPVDGKAFVDAADHALAKKMKGRYVPPEVQADMDALRNGGPMTYENFENMRTNLAAEARKADRAGDGNRAMATSIVRDALESVPMTGESAAIKPIADAARSAAKARFDLLKSDPAYKAAVNDTVVADDFINKYVINGKVEHVKTMRENLAGDPLAGQTIAAGAINYLKNRAGIINGDVGNFSQAGYNKAYKAVEPKIDQLVMPEQAQHLKLLGNVARYTQEQPRGSYVNNSNTFVAGAANAGKSALEGAVNVGLHGVPVGTWIRKGLEKRQMSKFVEETLKPGAGTKLSDFPK